MAQTFLLLSSILCALKLSLSFAPLPSNVRFQTPRALNMAANSNVMSFSSPQLLEFREPKTNVTVILVGAMHYNPTSVRLAKDTIEDLGQSDKLGSVVIESCDIRWNKTGELYEESPVMKKFLINEMRTASETAMLFKRPVVLGDQRINITSTALKNGFKQTFSDLANPISGWQRLFNEISEATAMALPTGPGYLGPFGFFDLRLLLAAPVSFVKYPLAFFYRSPLFTAIFLTLLASSSIEPSSFDSSYVAPENIEMSDILISVGISVLETVVFFRLLIKELLAERNEILARNILEQCKIYSKTSDLSAVAQNTFFGLRLPFVGQSSTTKKDDSDVILPEIIYAEDTMTNSLTPLDSNSNGDDKVVVAVLGMAHCNGIMKLLKEEKI